MMIAPMKAATVRGNLPMMIHNFSVLSLEMVNQPREIVILIGIATQGEVEANFPTGQAGGETILGNFLLTVQPSVGKSTMAGCYNIVKHSKIKHTKKD